MNALFAALLLAQAAAADPAKPGKPELPWRHHELALGAYIADLSSSVQVNSDVGVGGNVDLEELLGLENTLTQLRLGTSFYLADRHRLAFSVTDISRVASKQIEADITFDGVTYPVGTVVQTDFDLQLINLVYGYSLIYDERVDLAVTFGIHAMRTQVRLRADTVGSESEQFTIPIPLPGFRIDIKLAEDLYFRQSLEFLWLRLDNFEGLMVDAVLAIEWAAFESVGFGLAYNHMRINLEMESATYTGFEGKLEIDFAGFMLYTVVYF